MNNGADNKHLLADVLAEAAPADFREVLLGETLRLARRRRHRRQVQRVVAMLLMLGLLAVLLLENRPKKPAGSQPLAQKTKPAAYQLVGTRPFSTDGIVITRPLATEQFTASGEPVEIVQTTGGNYHLLNDAELMALVGNRPAVLIRTGPHSEELVFADLDDQMAVPAN